MLRALDLAEAIDQGDMSAGTVFELCAEAIEQREMNIRAFARLTPEAARKVARGKAAGQGPLLGLPVAIKDIIDTADTPTEYGSPIYRNWQPKADASVVQMLRAAGGGIIGKSVTTEFAQLNPPVTRNPHHPGHTPGGSSSGSAAAVAAGMVPLAIGTQTGGSIIRPAAFCGVAAIKPSFGLIPRVGVKTYAWSFDTVGLFGARAVDVAYGLSSLTGRPLRVDGVDHGAPKAGIFIQGFAGEALPEAHAAMKCVRKAFEKAGAKVSSFKAPKEFTLAHAAHAVINDYEAAHALAWERNTHRKRISAILLEALDRGAATPVEDYDAARGIAKRARRAAKGVFEEFDLLLTFSAPGAAPARESTGNAAFNRLMSLLGVPCVNVPVMKTEDGLPVGVQVIAGFGDDHLALAGAAILEAALAAS